MVSREAILAFAKKYQKPLLIIVVAWIFMVGAVITKIATLLMSPESPNTTSSQATTATQYDLKAWSDWYSNRYRNVRERETIGTYG